MSVWEITKDFFPEGKPGTNLNAVGVMGPRDGDFNKTRGYPFRMFDDDGVLCYEGLASECDFSPLEDFGTPNAGCTYIQYQAHDGTWATL